VVQRPRLCASAAITTHALFAEPSGGEVSEGVVFEVADHELDRGVVAVIVSATIVGTVRLVANAW
jgi:hypothetical protein